MSRKKRSRRGERNSSAPHRWAVIAHLTSLAASVGRFVLDLIDR